jgi:hypothetical protein
LHGFIERLSDLSWLGPNYQDQGWFIVGDDFSETFTSTSAEIAWNTAKQLLRDSDWTMISDIPMNKEEKIKWIEYRRALREVRLQAGFPDDIAWPTRPD